MIGTCIMRVAILLLTFIVAACGNAPTGPAGQPSVSNVNPETGARGGSSAGAGK